MSGQSYKDFCQNALFAPASIKTILPAARTAKQKQAQEVSYYPEKRGKLVKSIFSQDLEERLPAPYCQIDIERYIASFGWLSNAEEFLRFQYAVFGSAAYTNGRIDSTNNKLLSQASLAQMLARPALPDYQKSTGYVAAGYFLSSDYARGKASLFKDGTLSGSRSFFICFPDGTSCCALFNARPPYHKTDALQKEIRFLFDSISKSASAAGSPN